MYCDRDPTHLARRRPPALSPGRPSAPRAAVSGACLPEGGREITWPIRSVDGETTARPGTAHTIAVTADSSARAGQCPQQTTTHLGNNEYKFGRRREVENIVSEHREDYHFVGNLHRLPNHRYQFQRESRWSLGRLSDHWAQESERRHGKNIADFSSLRLRRLTGTWLQVRWTNY